MEECGGISPRMEDPGHKKGADPKVDPVRGASADARREDQRRGLGRDGTVNRRGGATTSTTPANMKTKPAMFSTI